MFYKILFLLTVMNFILDVKKYIHEYRVWLIAKNKVQCDDVPIGLYLKIGMSVWFYIMENRHVGMVLYNGADFDIQTTFTLVVLELIILISNKQ